LLYYLLVRPAQTAFLATGQSSEEFFFIQKNRNVKISPGKMEEKLEENTMKKIMAKKELLTFLPILSVFFFLVLPSASSSLINSTQNLPAPGKVEIREVQPFAYCSLSRTGSFEDIESMVGELMQHLQNQNIFPAGSMIGIFHGDPSLSDPSSIQWEIGFPVGEQVVVMAPLQKKVWTFTTVAVGIHEGPYEKTGETILKMREWLEENGYVQNGPVLERYLDPDPSRLSSERLRTEIWLPCKKI